MAESLQINTGLIGEIKSLIEKSKQNIAISVNSEMTLLYWQIGQRINSEILMDSRAEYGKQIVVSLARQLTSDYGGGWGDKQLRLCMKFAQVFNDLQIVYTVCRQLSYFTRPLKLLEPNKICYKKINEMVQILSALCRQIELIK
ncbi:MAG: DUF1016 N-terminal domain-containing protein [Bacteroidota bacterium]|nr:DUF1016 N-terminal domain-containing protein [Bacteroidota bacterium]